MERGAGHRIIAKPREISSGGTTLHHAGWNEANWPHGALDSYRECCFGCAVSIQGIPPVKLQL